MPCLPSDPPTFYQHVGLYAYRRDFLLQAGGDAAVAGWSRSRSSNSFASWTPAMRSSSASIDEPTFGIDTPDDYRAFVEKSRGHSPLPVG